MQEDIIVSAGADKPNMLIKHDRRSPGAMV